MLKLARLSILFVVRKLISCLILISVYTVLFPKSVFAQEVFDIPEQGSSSSTEQTLGLAVTTSSNETLIPLANCSKYVSLTGNDTNTGLAPTSSFKTIAKGISTLVPGEALCIGSGTYNEVLTVSTVGTAESRIRIGGYDGVGVVNISGKNFTAPAGNCTKVSNLRGTNSKTKATLANCSSTFLVTISGAKFTDLVGVTVTESAGSGVGLLSSENITLSSVVASNNNFFGAVVGSTCLDETTCVGKTTSDIQILNSKFQDNNAAIKINTLAVGAGLQLNGNALNTVTVKNSVVSKNLGFGLYSDGVTSLALEDSLFNDNLKDNLSVKNPSSTLINKNFVACLENVSARLSSVKNVTQRDYPTGVYISGVSDTVAASPDYIGTTFTNNIVYGCSTNIAMYAQRAKLKNFNVVNNTFVNARSRLRNNMSARSVLLIGSDIETLTFANNIVLQKDSTVRSVVGLQPNPALTIKSNYVFPAVSKSLVNKGFTVENPKLAAPFGVIDVNALSVSGFEYVAGSSAIGKGALAIPVTGLDTDYNGAVRGITNDPGALAYVPVVTLPIPDENPPTDVEDPTLPVGDPGVEDPVYAIPPEDEIVEYETSDVPEYTTPPTDPEEEQYEYQDYEDSTYEVYEEYEDQTYVPSDYSEEDLSYQDYESYDTTSTVDYEEPYPDNLYEISELTPSDPDYASFGNYDPDAYNLEVTDLLKNGNFELGKTDKGMPKDWYIKTGVDGAVSVGESAGSADAVSGKILSLKISKLPQKGAIELYQNRLSLKPGVKYKLSFWAKSDLGSDLDVSLSNSAFPYQMLTQVKYNVDIKPDWKEHTGVISLDSSAEGVSAVRLMFSLNGFVGDIFYIDRISLQELSPAGPDYSTGFLNEGTELSSKFAYQADFYSVTLQ